MDAELLACLGACGGSAAANASAAATSSATCQESCFLDAGYIHPSDTFTLPAWAALLLAAFLVTLSGLFSGLNLGLMSLDLIGLRVGVGVVVFFAQRARLSVRGVITRTQTHTHTHQLLFTQQKTNK